MLLPKGHVPLEFEWGSLQRNPVWVNSPVFQFLPKLVLLKNSSMSYLVIMWALRGQSEDSGVSKTNLISTEQGSRREIHFK